MPDFKPEVSIDGSFALPLCQDKLAWRIQILEWRGLRYDAPSHPISFIFMQFVAKILSNDRLAQTDLPLIGGPGHVWCSGGSRIYPGA